MDIGKRMDDEIGCWIKRTPFSEFYKAISKRIIGQSALKEVCTCVYGYLMNRAEGRTSNFSFILTAPSGCGKTETYRALRDYFQKEIPWFPILFIDTTEYTTCGFKGKDPWEMLSGLFEANTNGRGILWMDEFDKKVTPSRASDGSDANREVQTQILTMLEGRTVEDQRKGHSGSIDTSNTLIVASGSFDACRTEESEVHKHIGFDAKEERARSHYDEITREDIIRLGGCNEIVGRFTTVFNYQALSNDAVKRVIDVTVKTLSESYGVPIRLSKNARNELHEIANGPLGCRAIRNYIQETALKAYGDILESGSLKKEIIIKSLSEAVVREPRKKIVIHIPEQDM